MPDDPDVQSHPSVPAVTQDLLWSLDAAMPWERSRITLLIVSDVPDQTLVIEEIRAAVVRQWDERPKQMIYDSGHGCGDIKERVFDLSLHGGSAAMVDQGVVGVAGEDADAQLRNTPLGSSFTVSDTDPARVMVDVEACDQNYEFVLEVKYRSGGAEFIERIDDRGRPFRISGVPPESYWSNDWQAAPGDRLTEYSSLEERLH